MLVVVRMQEPREEPSPFFRAPPGIWPDVDAATWTELVALRELVASALDTAAAARPSPLEVALKLSEVANRLFAQLAPEERDLRQIISTLRTGHALAWDMYDAVEATRTTVEEHMRDLRQRIDEFEADLKELQRGRTGT